MRRLKPGNDNRPEPAPARSGEMPAIVTTVSRKRVTLLRAERASADGTAIPSCAPGWIVRSGGMARRDDRAPLPPP